MREILLFLRSAIQASVYPGLARDELAVAVSGAILRSGRVVRRRSSRTIREANGYSVEAELDT